MSENNASGHPKGGERVRQLLMPLDSVAGFGAVLVICALASVIAIRMALRVDPAEAIGG